MLAVAEEEKEESDLATILKIAYSFNKEVNRHWGTRKYLVRITSKNTLTVSVKPLSYFSVFP